MKKSKLLILALGIVPLVSVSFVTAASEGKLSEIFSSFFFKTRNTIPGDYTFHITSLDLANNYITTSSGNKLLFETSGVTASDGKIVIAKNGYLRMKDMVNGMTRISIDASYFSNDDQLMLQSGYNYDDYGAAVYLTKTASSAEMYYRTYFQFTSDTSAVSVASITVNYTCEAHYEFTPVMEHITQNVSSGSGDERDVYHYEGLSYEGGTPNFDEVRLEPYRFELDLSNPEEQYDPTYSIHPVAKFYDKGDCLIKQATGFWLCHVSPIIRFYTSKDKFEIYAFTKGDTFDTSVNGPLYQSNLAAYDWSEYTQPGEVLTQPLEASLDLYPKVKVNINPGAYSSDAKTTVSFTPNKNAVNYGFPSVADPTIDVEYTSYSFVGWYNGEEPYDPATASDFHDYDLYAEYSSEFDLRIRFQTRGFNNPYLEIGVPNHESRELPAASTFVDQSTVGMLMDNWVDSDFVRQDPKYLIYPQGHRELGQLYSPGEMFLNDDLGSDDERAIYIAEPYMMFDTESMFSYLEFEKHNIFDPKTSTHHGMVLIAKHRDHMDFDGINDKRTYFKKLVLPDSIYFGSILYTHASVQGTLSQMTDIVPKDDEIFDCGINNSKELEVIVGNDWFNNLYGTGMSRGFGFARNAELRRLEYFPALTDIMAYTFYQCPKLEPIQNWKDMGPIDEIYHHAFDGCYVNPIIDENGNISRRRFEVPSTVEYLGNYVFAYAVYTDFYLDSTNLSNININSFAYSDKSGVHSDDFAAMLAKYNNNEVDVAALKGVANHVIFNGTRAQFESLVGTYNELDTLINKEYYVTFND